MTDTEPNDMALTTKINNLFKSRVADAVETVSSKLEAARQHHAALLAQQAEAAFNEAIGEDGATEKLAALMAEIAAGDEKIRLLTLALEEAQRREVERKRLARLQADKSRVRALTQHLASLKVASAEYQRAVEHTRLAWGKMVDAGRRAEKLTTHLDSDARDKLSTKHLRQLCEAELVRQVFPVHPLQVDAPLPSVFAPHTWEHDVMARQLPLVDEVGRWADWATGQTTSHGETLAEAAPVIGSAFGQAEFNAAVEQAVSGD